MPDLIHLLPHVNATLNATAAILLVVGYILIRRRQESAHRRVMLLSFAVSVVFLACYLIYHWQAGSTRFPTYPPRGIRIFYLSVLASHIVLAAAVPFLAMGTIVLGLKGRRAAHRRLARWTFPIWLYVSVTGVIVYAMLYHLYPPQETTARKLPVAAERSSEEPAPIFWPRIGTVAAPLDPKMP